VFIGGKPITITIQDIFIEDGDEFVTFVDQNNEHRAIRSDQI